MESESEYTPEEDEALLIAGNRIVRKINDLRAREMKLQRVLDVLENESEQSEQKVSSPKKPSKRVKHLLRWADYSNRAEETRQKIDRINDQIDLLKRQYLEVTDLTFQEK